MHRKVGTGNIMRTVGKVQKITQRNTTKTTPINEDRMII
jgi:hypothetical protein